MCGRFALRNFYMDRVANEYPDVPPRRWDDEDRFHPRYNVAPQTQVLALMQQPNGQGQQEVVVQTMVRPPVFGMKTPPKRVGNTAMGTSSPMVRPQLVLVQEPNQCAIRRSSAGYGSHLEYRTGYQALYSHLRRVNSSVYPSSKPAYTRARYYEWRKLNPRNRKPHYIKHPDARLMLMAGFYEIVKMEPKPTYTCTILTTEANQQLAFLHDRMPVILNGAQAVKWLEAGDGKKWRPEVLEELSGPYDGNLICYEVPSEVGKVGNEDPSFVEPIKKRNNTLNAMLSKMAEKSNAEAKPVVSSTKLQEPIQVLSDSDEDVKPKLKGSSPASRATGSSPALRRFKSSKSKPAKREAPSSPSKPTKREASPPVLVSSDSESDEIVLLESLKRRKTRNTSHNLKRQI
ncbi:inner membrane AAA protease Yta12-like protein [Ceratobasidium sp. AG-Ba]|nr:inner membrane AAA protease Yta12-like protein [Ceratobasidium sp. AG-Ba]